MDNVDIEDIVDVLTEIGNIGAGNAATAFSRQLEKDMMIDVTKVHFVLIEDVPDIIGILEAPATGVYMNLPEFGVGMLLFSMGSARKIVRMFKGVKVSDVESSTTWVPTEDEISALSEIGNICISAYVTALSTIIGRYIIPMPPQVAIDMLGALLDMPLAEVAERNVYALVIETDFRPVESDITISGHLLFIPYQDIQKELIEKMRSYDV